MDIHPEAGIIQINRGTRSGFFPESVDDSILCFLGHILGVGKNREGDDGINSKGPRGIDVIFPRKFMQTVVKILLFLNLERKHRDEDPQGGSAAIVYFVKKRQITFEGGRPFKGFDIRCTKGRQFGCKRVLKPGDGLGKKFVWYPWFQRCEFDGEINDFFIT